MGSKANKIILMLRALTVAYNKPCTDEFLEVFTDGLMEIDADWEKVYATITSNSEYMPNLKQVRDFALGRDPSKAPIAATKIIDDVRKAVERIGRYNFQRARDELSLEAWGFVQNYGGWSQVCSIDFKAQSTFAGLQRTAIGVLDELNKDADYAKRIKLAQTKGTNDSRALTGSPQSSKAPEGDSSFDPRKLIEEAFTDVKTAKNIESEIDIEKLKEKAKKGLKNI